MDRKEIVKYFYEVVVTNHLLEEVDQYVSEDCVLKSGEELIPIGIEGMRRSSDCSKEYISRLFL